MFGRRILKYFVLNCMLSRRTSTTFYEDRIILTIIQVMLRCEDQVSITQVSTKGHRDSRKILKKKFTFCKLLSSFSKSNNNNEATWIRTEHTSKKKPKKIKVKCETLS